MSRDNIEDVYALSPMQKGLLFHALAAPDSPAYRNQLSCTLRGPLDLEKFLAAWQVLVDRHTSLRTAFSWRDLEEPVQVVLRRAPLAVDVDDWRGLPRAEQEEKLRTVVREDLFTPFHLSRPPLMRLKLIRRAEQEHHFVWTHHHLIVDGWSISILMQEVFAVYHGLLTGRRHELKPVRPFKDYVAWLDRLPAAEAEAFWLRNLAGFQVAADLGIHDRQPPSAPGRPPEQMHFATEVAALSVDETNALHRFARRCRITLGTIMQAAWAILLSRTGGETDVVLGLTMSGRPRSLVGADSMVGMFVNTVPARIRVSPHQSVGEWLTDLQGKQAELFAFEFSPLQDIQRLVGVPGNIALFETALIFENFPVFDGFSDRETDLQIANVETVRYTNFPIAITITPTERLSIRVSYDSGRFSAQAIQRLVRQFRVLLSGLAAHRYRRVSDLPILPEAERHQLVVRWNDTAVAHQQRCVHEILAAQAARQPDAIALVHGERHLTYAGLERRANAAARFLRRQGVGPDVVVALLMPRSIDLVAAMLAVFKAGGAYLPLDPENPMRRNLRLLEQGSVARVIATREFGAALANEARAKALEGPLEIFEIERLGEGERSDPVPWPCTQRQLAYVIYTSGSTGVPKGAMIDHLGMLNHLYGKLSYLRLGAADIVAQTASQSFDISVWQFLAVLLAGGRVHIVSSDIATDPQRLFAMVEAERITVLEIVPSLLGATLENGDDRHGASLGLAALRWLLLTGEALPPPLVGRWLRRYPTIPIVNAYGPTECSDDVTHHVIRDPVAEADVHIPIGRPLPNACLYVLDRWQQLVPSGARGELCVGGVCVGRGYLKDAARTAAAFVPDPFGARGERLYLTGDVARWREDGCLDFLGRRDHQVKLRGYRIELGEVEVALRRAPGVRDAAVVARDERLIGYVAGMVDANALREELRRQLPDYMLPSIIVPLQTLPLTPNGKVDRKALPAPEAAPQAQYLRPRTVFEDMLAGIWADVLHVPRVNVTDNFFERGGHSLLAMRVVARLRDMLDIDLPLNALFEAPTVSALAERVAIAQQQECEPAPPLLPRQPCGDIAALSFGQERLWLLDQVGSLGAAYNVMLAVRLEGGLNVLALEAALGGLIARHEVLRTRLAIVDGGPVQVIAPTGPFRLSLCDISDLAAEERAPAAQAFTRALVQRPFDLASELLRVMVLRLTPAEHVLVIVLHHIIADAWSTGVLIHEIGTLYSSAAAGRPSPLAALPVQYADYALWQRAWLQGETLDRQVSYWKKCLAEMPAALELPTDRVRPAVQSFRGAAHGFSLPARLSAALAELGRQEGATLYMVLLAAFQLLLCRYSRQEDIVVGSPIAGRGRRETEGLIGFFVNTLVLRTDLSGDPRFRTLLGRVKETALEAYAHQDLPFEKLVEVLQPVRDLSRQPIFQVMLALQNVPRDALDVAGMKLSAVADESATAKFDLSLIIEETPGGLAGRFEYATDLFERTTVERLAGHFERLLEGIVADPARRLSELPILGEAEWHRLVVEWNDTAAAVPDGCVHELFAAQAARTPQAIALVHDSQQLSYGELERRANQLAHHLRDLGVGPEVIVGLCVERSLEMVVGLLGILKAGAAYLPLDPSDPPDRLAYIMGDAKAPVLLTQAKLADRVPADSAHMVRIDADWAAISACPTTAPCSQAMPGNLAYTIYTSGSTGRPKGVAVCHASIVRLIKSSRHFVLRQDDIFIHFASLAFDASTFEIWGALLNGAKLIVYADERADLARMKQVLAEERVGVMLMVAGLFHRVVDDDLQALAPIKKLLVGGDALSLPHVTRALDRLKPLRLVNAYGPTEGTTYSACFVIDGSIERRATVPIGSPIANAQVYILDDLLAPAPVGVRGEICIGGDGLARGYSHRPSLTAERFVPSPFGIGKRLYRTGDTGRWRLDGVMEFLGRRDHQVKIRGHRIELGEVQAELAHCPGIQHGIVVAREDTPGDKRLVGYVVAAGDFAPSPIELRGHLQRSLPHYMIPSAFVVLDDLPLTMNGKVDHGALPAPDGRPAIGLYAAPRTSTEEALVSIWRELLKLDRIGIEDNFFELGGHSLLATQLIVRVRESLSVGLPLQVLFEAPTVRELAERIEVEQEAYAQVADEWVV